MPKLSQLIEMAKEPKSNYSVGRNKRLELSRQALRAKIDGSKCIDELDAVATEAVGAEASAVPALRLRADIARDKLKKVLPDLRSVEITDDRGDRPAEEMTDEEIAARLSEVAQLRAELAKRDAAPEGGENVPPGVH